jgi:hypothetical protein
METIQEKVQYILYKNSSARGIAHNKKSATV